MHEKKSLMFSDTLQRMWYELIKYLDEAIKSTLIVQYLK